MNLHRMLEARDAEGKPIRVVLIGAGKFGSMFLAQVRTTPGMHLVAVADLGPDRARAALKTTGWEAERCEARSLADAASHGSTYVTDDAFRCIGSDHVDVVIDATGSPSSGIEHVLACCEHRKHVVMVNVEADALAGPLLAQQAAQAGVV